MPNDNFNSSILTNFWNLFYAPRITKTWIFWTDQPKKAFANLFNLGFLSDLDEIYVDNNWAKNIESVWYGYGYFMTSYYSKYRIPQLWWLEQRGLRSLIQDHCNSATILWWTRVTLKSWYRCGILGLALSSRKNLCIHPEVMQQQNGKIIDGQCQVSRENWSSLFADSEFVIAFKTDSIFVIGNDNVSCQVKGPNGWFRKVMRLFRLLWLWRTWICSAHGNLRLG